jgi:hypothetical protein
MGTLKSYFVAWTLIGNLVFTIIDSIVIFKYKDEKTKTYVSIDLLFLVLISLFLIFLFEKKKNNNPIIIQSFRILFIGIIIFYISTITTLPRNEYLTYFIIHSTYSLCFFFYFFCLSIIPVEK